MTFRHKVIVNASKLESLLATDEITDWNYEGNGSICTSLSSLDNDSVTTDWEDTLRSYGPKFTKIADMVSGEDTDSNRSSYQEDGGTEV